jgi:hypothetical protein
VKYALSLFLALVSAWPIPAKKKPVLDCKIKFAFVYVDRLNNTYHGIQGDQLKDVQKKLNKFGDVCYTADEAMADFVFFVHTRPAVYHGVRTSTSQSTQTDSSPVSGTVTDEDGNTSTINGTIDTTTTSTTTSSAPYEVDYSVFILDIMVPHPKQGSTEKSFSILHSFDQKGLYNTIYGIGYGKGKHPIVNVIDSAAKWLHENNFGRAQQVW